MTVVVPSPSMKLLVRDRFGITCVLIPNGVNTELFHPTSEDVRKKVRTHLGVRQDEFCLCYLGSIENWLDLESVVHALTKLKSVRLVMIGGPPRSEAYLQSILALCDKEGVLERVTSTGFKNQAEAAKILSACDAAIIPFPLNRELSAVALPDKTFEYLASGVPVISTRLPDVEKLFGDLIYFYDNPDELCDILLSLANDPSKCNLREQISQAKKYDWKVIAGTYEDLISRLVTSNMASKIKRD
jgi:glycosyltransferase involved in cell wall biosynthesis